MSNLNMGSLGIGNGILVTKTRKLLNVWIDSEEGDSNCPDNPRDWVGGPHNWTSPQFTEIKKGRFRAFGHHKLHELLFGWPDGLFDMKTLRLLALIELESITIQPLCAPITKLHLKRINGMRQRFVTDVNGMTSDLPFRAQKWFAFWFGKALQYDNPAIMFMHDRMN